MKMDLKKIWLFNVLLFLSFYTLQAGNGYLAATNYQIGVNENVGRVTLNWDIGGYSHYQLYVNEENKSEVQFEGSVGRTSKVASFIKRNTKYTFSLYVSNTSSSNLNVNGELRDRITIPLGEVDASIYAVPTKPSNYNKGETYISWSAPDVPYTQLWVQTGNEPEKLCTCAGSSRTAYKVSYIQKGKTYKFKLYTASSSTCSSTAVNKGFLLDEITVAGGSELIKQVGLNKVNLVRQYYGMIHNGAMYPANGRDQVKRLAEKSIKDAGLLGFGYMRVPVSFLRGSELSVWKNDAENYWNTIDTMMAHLNKYNVKIIPVLSWSTDQFKQNYPEINHYTFFTDHNCAAKQELKLFIEQFVSRYKNNPAVLFWELHNECNLNLNGNWGIPSLKRKDVLQTHTKWMCELIRSLDPFHMISSGHQMPRPIDWNLWINGSTADDTYNQFKEILAIQNKYCDIVSVHVYGWTNRFGHTENGGYNYDYLTDVNDAVKGMHKLLYIGEFGAPLPKYWGLQLRTTNPDDIKTRLILDQIAKNDIPFSSPWIWEFHETYSFREGDKNGNFVIDPCYTFPVINKMNEVNGVLGNQMWEPVYPDVTPPTTVIAFPYNGSSYEQTPPFNGDQFPHVYTKVSDNNLYIDSVELYIDGELANTSYQFPFRNAHELQKYEKCMHKIEVLAYDNSGNVGKDSIMLYNTHKRPIEPTVVTNTDDFSVSISWPDCYIDELGYEIYKMQDDGSWSLLATVTNPYYIDDDVVEGNQYFYKTRAVLSEGAFSSYSAVARTGVLEEGGIYQIKNVATGLFMGLYNSNLYDDKDIRQENSGSGNNKKWVAVKNKNSYMFINLVSGKAVDLLPANNSYVVHHTDDDDDSQLWSVSSAGDNSFYVANYNSGRYLRADVNNIHVRHVGNDNSDYMKWQFIKTGNVCVDIEISNTSVLENKPIGSNVGQLTMKNAQENEVYTFSLNPNELDNSLFVIEDNVLKTASVFDSETKNKYNLIVTMVDGDGVVYKKAFYIYVDVEVVNLKSQFIPLNEGLNYISINVIPEDNSVGSIFDGLDVDQVKNVDLYWRPSDPLSSLSHLNAGEGYVVIMNNPGLLKITGVAADFSNYTFPSASGWHLIGNPFGAFQKFENVFSSETCELVKHLEKYWSPDGVYSDHKCFEPGKGYYLLNK